MCSSLSLGGLVLTAQALLGLRWLGPSELRSVACGALALEFGGCFFWGGWSASADSAGFLEVGAPAWGSSTFEPSLALTWDRLSYFFFGVLVFSLTLCLVFLGEYFEYDSGAAGIIALSSIFSQLALGFFASADVLGLVFFWEAISFVSFFLIQHWAQRLPSYKAGLKVFLVSQFGDLWFLLALVWGSAMVESGSLAALSTLAPAQAGGAWLGASGFVGGWGVIVMGSLAALALKSAQFFFYPWLLDAMEAPVPISSQLHSSTLVVIGFYVFFRLVPVGDCPLWASEALVVMGSLTVVGASCLGFFQVDGKRMLACSTAGQLGYVVVGMGLGLYEESMVLLGFCCCSKAYVFVWLGVFMERWGGVSDLRLVGGDQGAFAERAGLGSAAANLTVAPGAFAWHAKSLLSSGSQAEPFWGWGPAAELLSLTWFFSGIYLLKLLVLSTGSTSRARGQGWAQPTWAKNTPHRAGPSLAPYLVICAAVLGVWGGCGLFGGPL